jgi:hypothetical protein
MPESKGCSEWVRDYLQEHGEAHVTELRDGYNDFCASLDAENRSRSHDSMRREVWILKQLGLVEQTRKEPGERGGQFHYYRAVPTRLSDDRWHNPQAELYGGKA